MLQAACPPRKGSGTASPPSDAPGARAEGGSLGPTGRLYRWRSANRSGAIRPVGRRAERTREEPDLMPRLTRRSALASAAALVAGGAFPLGPRPAPAGASDGWRPLFNGRDLSGS